MGGTPSQVWVGRAIPGPGGRDPIQVQVGGYPIPGLNGGTQGYPPGKDWMGYPLGQEWMGIPGQDWMGYPPRPGLDGVPPRPGLDGVAPSWPGLDGVPPSPIIQSSIASTCYAVGSMPLAFTQEDFFVVFVFIVRHHFFFLTPSVLNVQNTFFIVSNSTDPSTRLVSSSTRNSMQLINSTCLVEHD